MRSPKTEKQILFSLISAMLLAPALLAQMPTVTVFASGLNNPRGLRFGPDGYLYVAEGGTGGSISSEGQCDQVVPPIGPYTGGFTSRISKLNRHGVRTTVADNLPSSQTSAGSGALVSGVSDLEFVDNQLYALFAGSGCSHGLASTVNGIFKVEKSGHLKLVADLSDFAKTHPVANPDLEDFEPDGTWYSMVAHDGGLYVTEPNHQEVDRISVRDGKIDRVVDVSIDHPVWIGPTALVFHHGHLVFGTLGPFPITPGTEDIYKLHLNGDYGSFASGFTTVQGLAYDDHGRLYVLESMTQPGFPSPAQLGSGMIVRIDRFGVVETIATGLSFPSAMTFGPDGNLYVSNQAFALPPGNGQIVRVELAKERR
jgi:hypothetical protein